MSNIVETRQTIFIKQPDCKEKQAWSSIISQIREVIVIIKVRFKEAEKLERAIKTIENCHDLGIYDNVSLHIIIEITNFFYSAQKILPELETTFWKCNLLKHYWLNELEENEGKQ